MNFSNPCELVAAALVLIQGKLEDPHKNRKVEAGPKKYSYAELDKCLPDIRALCVEHDVYIGQSCDEANVMHTTLLHKSGQWVTASCPVTLPAKTGDPQAFGSAITYARRYGLFMALGLAAQNEDNDGKMPESKDRKREAPDAKKARQDQHHESWTKDTQKRFMGDLKKAGYPHYDEVCAWLASLGGGKRPSQMNEATRKKLLAKLILPSTYEKFKAWLAKVGQEAAGEDAEQQYDDLPEADIYPDVGDR